MSLLVLRVFVFATILTPTIAQSPGVFTPRPGSAERKAILNALRVPIEKELKQEVRFVVQRQDGVERFKVQSGWALLMVTPQQPNGSPVNYRNTPYQQAIDDGVFDEGVYALLRNEKGKWKVVKYAVGPTDVPFTEWRGAPSTLFKAFFGT